MAHWTPQYRIALIGGMLSYSAQLLVGQDAQAHTNHDHTKKAEPAESAAASAQQTPASESAAVEEPAATLDKVDSDAVTMPPSEMHQGVPEKTTAIQEVPVNQASPSTAVSQAELLNGFSIGLGEVILGLIIIGPLLLQTLKKQLRF